MPQSAPKRRNRRDVDGYPSGPDAPQVATAAALERATTARTVVLVEGISDQIALETMAARRGRDLAAEAVVVIPVGGAHAITRAVERFGPNGQQLQIRGLCDIGEVDVVRGALIAGGVNQRDVDGKAGGPLARYGFGVCNRDLEDELIRAAGGDLIEATLQAEGDLGSFATLCKQPAWRDSAFHAQFHRWLRAGARRSQRYAHLLCRALPVGAHPVPLLVALGSTDPGDNHQHQTQDGSRRADMP